MTQLASLDKYHGRFGNQEQRETRNSEVFRNPIMEEMCRRFERWLEIAEGSHIDRDFYDPAISSIRGFEYTSEDVRNFSLAMGRYQSHRNFCTSGTFLSALINKSHENDFEVVTEHLPKIEDIAYNNRKNIVIHGDVGSWIGRSMEEGSVLINGNTEGLVGFYMVSGKITIKGNTEYAVGEHMLDGEIIVEGDAGEKIGNNMKGGILRIEGKIRSISEYWQGGKIYHRGLLIRGKE